MKMDVPLPNIENQPNGVIPVSKLEVGLSNTQTTILLGVWASGENAQATTYALSPPAAARLSQELQRAVEEYLYSPPVETE